MSSPNREQMIRMAIETARQGNTQGARMMLQQVLQEDRNNERAMLTMAKISRSSDERQKWLERVLEVNPENESARTALDRMVYTSAASENRTLFYFGGAVTAAFMLITLLWMAYWAFAASLG